MSVSYTEGHDMEVIKEYFDIEKKINQIEAERFESFWFFNSDIFVFSVPPFY